MGDWQCRSCEDDESRESTLSLSAFSRNKDEFCKSRRDLSHALSCPESMRIKDDDESPHVNCTIYPYIIPQITIPDPMSRQKVAKTPAQYSQNLTEWNRISYFNFWAEQ